MLAGDPADTAHQEAQGRRRFHVALAGVFGLVLAPFVSWWLAVWRPESIARPWRQRLVGLAIVDTVAFLCLTTWCVLSVASETDTPAPPPPARIGVEFNHAGPPDGLEIVRVMAGSPAEQAGLRAGDKVTGLDESSVENIDRFREDVGRTPPGAVRTLHVERDGSELDVSVVPAVRWKSPPQPALPLFVPRPAPEDSWPMAPDGTGIFGVLVVLAIIAVVARKRRAPLRPVVQVAGAMTASSGIAFAVFSIFRGTVGPSLGAALLACLLGELTMLLLASFWMRGMDRAARTAAAASATLGAVPAFGLGLFYSVVGVLRAAMVIVPLLRWLHVSERAPSGGFDTWPELGADGIALVMLTVVVMAPIAEESLFRGVLLPWLTTWTGPTAAIVASALAFGAGHLYYGSKAPLAVVYGAVLGWARLRTGRLRASIALHMFINAAAAASLLWAPGQ